MSDEKTPASPTQWLVVAGNAWAKRPTFVETIVGACKEGHLLSEVKVYVRYVTKDAYVDEFGTLHATKMRKLKDFLITKKIIDKANDLQNEIEKEMDKQDYDQYGGDYTGPGE